MNEVNEVNLGVKMNKERNYSRYGKPPEPRKLRQLRDKHRFKQSEMAQIVCVHPNTWAQWERGIKPMPSTLWRLACYELGEVDEVKRGDVVNALNEVSLTDIINEMTIELRNKGQEI